MPTYGYRCKACGHEFEELQSMSEAPLVKCPKCAKRKLVRLISGAGLVFKGSGFYLTDYKQKGSSAAEAASESKSDAGESTPAVESSTGKGDKKSGETSKPTPAPKKTKGGAPEGGSSGSKD